MDVTEAMESQYVTVELVKHSNSRVALITSEGEFEEAERGRRLTLTVDIDGKHKFWLPNPTSVKSLVELFGSKESLNWIGKKVLLDTLRISGKDSVIVKVNPNVL